MCGHHRSGTTLVQELLDGHPELLVLPSEGTYFTSFAYAARPSPAAHDVDRFIADWIGRLVDPNYEPHFKLGRSGSDGNPGVALARYILGWQASLCDARPEHAQFALLLALIVAFKEVTAAATTPRLWVEKTPLNERYVHRFGAFPRARYIHVVRDPRPTLGSLREIYRAAGKRAFHAAEHARSIGRSLELAHENGTQLGDRYLVVRYEDLTEDASREMERIRRFLGISPGATLSTPTVMGLAVRSNSSFRRCDAGAIERARQTDMLGEADRRLVSALTGAAARFFGYEFAPASLEARFVSRLRSLPWIVRDRLRRIRQV